MNHRFIHRSELKLPVVGLAVLLASSCFFSTRAEPHCDGLPWEQIEAIALSQSFEPVSKATVECTPLKLQVVPVDAWQILFRARVPALEVLAIRRNSEVTVLRHDKQLGSGWQEIASDFLKNDVGQLLSTEQASALARDLTRVLVDSNPRYGVVLESRGDVPIDYESSDRLRDLRKAGLGAEKIESILLTDAPHRIDPPRIIADTRLVFYTWHYFGGEVARWVVEPSQNPAIRREIVATRVGSFDQYY